LVGTKVNYDAKFNQLEIAFFPTWILKDSSLTIAGRVFLKILLSAIEKTDALRSKYSRGQPFTLLWVTLILVFVALLVSLYSCKVWMNTGVDSGRSTKKKSPMKRKRKGEESMPVLV